MVMTQTFLGCCAPPITQAWEGKRFVASRLPDSAIIGSNMPIFSLLVLDLFLVRMSIKNVSSFKLIFGHL